MEVSIEELKKQIESLTKELENFKLIIKRVSMAAEIFEKERDELKESVYYKKRDIDKLIEDREQLRIGNNNLRLGKARLEAQNAKLKSDLNPFRDSPQIAELKTKLANSEKARLDAEAENALMRTVLTESQSALIVSEMRRL